jgi:hypothetical protein
MIHLKLKFLVYLLNCTYIKVYYNISLSFSKSMTQRKCKTVWSVSNTSCDPFLLSYNTPSETFSSEDFFLFYSCTFFRMAYK